LMKYMEREEHIKNNSRVGRCRNPNCTRIHGNEEGQGNTNDRKDGDGKEGKEGQNITKRAFIEECTLKMKKDNPNLTMKQITTRAKALWRARRDN